MNLPRATFRKRIQGVLLFSTLLSLLFAPQIWLKIKYKDLIYGQVDALPPQEFAVVFGAWVQEDGSLSDVTGNAWKPGCDCTKRER